MQPASSDFWFLPLGGTGEIGMNMSLYGHDGHWLIVDCGVTFAKPGEAGPHVQMADPAGLSDRAIRPDALLLTHAHEDHVGAVAHLWPRLRCPVYGTRFTLEILRRKLQEQGLQDAVPMVQVAAGEAVVIGPFSLEWLGMTHSIPESHGLVLRTRAGTVFHTGDWKLDPDPVAGMPFDEAGLQRLRHADLLALVCDSTNAMEPGWSTSEGALREGLQRVIGKAPGRVVVTTFGSNIARLHTLAAVARLTGRRFGVLGRSLQNMVAAARATGLWHPDQPLLDAFDLGYLPPEEVLLVATGSQGDQGAALDRLARNKHPLLDLEAGDCVVFSSRVIPGNETSVQALERALERRGIACVTADEDLIHASGHPCQDELSTLYEWTRPELVVPVHGTPAHLAAQAELARNCGVPLALRGFNGDLFKLAPEPGVVRGWLAASRLGLGLKGLEVVPAPQYSFEIHPDGP